MTKSKLFVILLVMLIISSASAQQKTVGIFDGQVDVGKNVKLGQGIYLPETQQYVLAGAGCRI